MSPQTRRQRKKRLKNSSHTAENEFIYLVPSNHITIFMLDGAQSLGIFVSRFWVRRVDDERNIFIFFDKNRRHNLQPISISTLGAPLLVECADELPQIS